MKKKIIKGLFVMVFFLTPFILLRSFLFGVTSDVNKLISPNKSIYDISAKLLNGKKVKLEEFIGKKLLLVNVASNCGYTYQYEQLQKLHENYGDKVYVVAFPSNDFGFQEPGSDNEIKEFCETNYGITFTMFSKIKVIGKNKHPIYEWLSNPKLNGWNKQGPTWNFCKYLIDKEGKLVRFYNSNIKPMSDEIINDINS